MWAETSAKASVWAGVRHRACVGVLALAHVTPGAAQAVLEEVLVTAQKRTESLQDVGLSVTALSADRLEQNPTTNAMDLVNLAPSVSAGENFGFAQIFIRGIGVDNLFNGADPSVAMHVDGAVIGRPAAQMGSFFDLERVEVLRGPQGTLYGRNSTGGSINLITNKPTAELAGYARVTAGNYRKGQVDAALSGPLGTDFVRGRLAAQYDERDGYGTNIFDGSDVDDAKRRSVRAQLQLNPEGAVSFLLSGEYHDEDDHAYSYKFRDVNYPGTTDPGFMASGVRFGGSFATNPRNVNSNVAILNDRETWAITGTLEWRFNDELRMVSLTNRRDFRLRNRFDFDLTQLPLFSEAQPEDSQQFSEELQLHWQSGKIQALFGLYYVSEDLSGRNIQGGTGIDDPYSVPLSSLFVAFDGTVDIEAYAAFANLNYELTDKVSLVLGGRYSDETRKLDTAFNKTPAATVIGFKAERSFSDFTPRVGVELRAIDDVLLYATYSQGFKSGIALTGSISPVLKPETVDAYEVGLKGRFFHDRLQTNASVFYYDFTDLQVGRTQPQLNPAGVPTGGFQTIFENAAAATNQGAEVEVSWAATEALRIDGFIGYLDAKFEDFLTKNPLQANQPTGQIPQQVAGNRMVQSPEWSANLRAQYVFAQASGARVTAAVEGNYKDKIYFTAFNDDRLGQDAVTTLDANVRFASPGERWSVNVWGKNLTDEFIWSSSFPISTSRTIMGTQAPPRTYGITAAFDF